MHKLLQGRFFSTFVLLGDSYPFFASAALSDSGTAVVFFVL
jgi:hypothetical protein